MEYGKKNPGGFFGGVFLLLRKRVDGIEKNKSSVSFSRKASS